MFRAALLLWLAALLFPLPMPVQTANWTER
jgi:hypothetical protein